MEFTHADMLKWDPVQGQVQRRYNECDGVLNHRRLDFYPTACSGAYQRKHQSSASLAFVWEIHRRPVNSPHKGPVTRKIFPFDYVFMLSQKYFRAKDTLEAKIRINITHPKLFSDTCIGSYPGHTHYTTPPLTPLLRLWKSLQWRHNDGVSNQRRSDGLLNRLFGRRPKKTSKLCVTNVFEGNPPVTGD